MDSEMDPTIIAGGLLIVIVILAIVLVRMRSSDSPSSSTTTKSGTSSSSSSTASAPVEDTRPLVHFYVGTQTGTAQGFAESLAREASKHRFRAEVIDLDNFGPRNPTTEALYKAQFVKGGYYAVFTVATYGDGDPTENAQEFMRWLRDDTRIMANGETKPLRKLQYSVFGLGNRQYEHFNKMGKDLHARLEALGGVCAYKYGEGDDDGSMDADFQMWREGLWSSLVAAEDAKNGSTSGGGSSTSTIGSPFSGNRAHARSVSNVESDEIPTFDWRVVDIASPSNTNTVNPILSGNSSGSSTTSAALIAGAARASKPFYEAVPVKIVKNVELRPVTGVGASTRHVDLDLSGTGLSYVTADNLYICPDNEQSVVEHVAKRLEYSLTQWFNLEPNNTQNSSSNATRTPQTLFPTPCTVQQALTRYFSLTGKVDHNFLEQLIPFTTKDADRTRLRFLLSKEGRAEFDSWSTKPQRSVMEVFDAFPSISLPLTAFVHICPKMQPRAYTIASSSAVSPTIVSVCASVLDEVKPGYVSSGSSSGGSSSSASDDQSSSRRLRGVCTNQLLRLASGGEGGGNTAKNAANQAPQTLRVYIRPSTFGLPSSPSVPIILIGPGTGIAPMMAFLQERRYQKSTAAAAAVGDTILFFGCRKSTEDFIYEKELRTYVADNTLTALHLAFSRETPNKKVYVQHLLQEQGDHIWRYLNDQGAHVYVCGATKMGADVLKAIEQIVVKHGKKTHPEAVAYVESLEKMHRYVQELWSG